MLQFLDRNLTRRSQLLLRNPVKCHIIFTDGFRKEHFIQLTIGIDTDIHEQKLKKKQVVIYKTQDTAAVAEA